MEEKFENKFSNLLIKAVSQDISCDMQGYKEMKIKRVMIAAPKSGSGKTTITCALLQSLNKAGQQVVSYKCGPDYIDPMFHKKILGIPSKNLDTFFTGEDTRTLFLNNRTEEDFVVIEGVMGIFDGLGGIREEGSSYHLAKITKTPIILVVDAKGMGRSVIPMISGFLSYDEEHLIKGVLLNRMSKSYYEMIKTLIEEELDICVVGYFADHQQFTIESRHLGLMMPEELTHINDKLSEISQSFEQTASVDEIVRIAEQAEELEYRALPVWYKENTDRNSPIIAVARDEAFCFYYEDNLLMLKENGAKIEFFSPLHDKKLPDGCNGFLIGGGYPELYAEALSANTDMLKEIKNAMVQRMPMVAECGGFMYLHTAMIDKEGKSHTMAGVIPAICHDTGTLVRFGYIELEERGSHFLPEGGRIRGHEFHYFDSSDNGNDCQAFKPVTGKSYSCIITGENYFLGFPHLYYPSNPSFAKSFVEKARAYQNSHQDFA